jgi:hypothetical protein
MSMPPFSKALHLSRQREDFWQMNFARTFFTWIGRPLLVSSP